MSCQSQTFSWQTGGVRTKAANTTGFPGQLLFSFIYLFIHSFIYFYLYLQELGCRGLAPQGARTDGFIMLFTCCFTRLAPLIFTSKRFSKAHRRLVPAFQSLNWRPFSFLCVRVFIIPRLSLSIFLHFWPNSRHFFAGRWNGFLCLQHNNKMKTKVWFCDFQKRSEAHVHTKLAALHWS